MQPASQLNPHTCPTNSTSQLDLGFLVMIFAEKLTPNQSSEYSVCARACACVCLCVLPNAVDAVFCYCYYCDYHLITFEQKVLMNSLCSSSHYLKFQTSHGCGFKTHVGIQNLQYYLPYVAFQSIHRYLQ